MFWTTSLYANSAIKKRERKHYRQYMPCNWIFQTNEGLENYPIWCSNYWMQIWYGVCALNFHNNMNIGTTTCHIKRKWPVKKCWNKNGSLALLVLTKRKWTQWNYSSNNSSVHGPPLHLWRRKQHKSLCHCPLQTWYHPSPFLLHNVDYCISKASTLLTE